MRRKGDTSKAPSKGCEIARLVSRFKGGETMTAKELGQELWPKLPPHLQVSYAYGKLRCVKDWFLREGKSFGNSNGTYQPLDETNIVRSSDNKITMLRSWQKNVQNEIDVGMEQFASDKDIREFFEMAILELHKSFIESREKNLKILTG